MVQKIELTERGLAIIEIGTRINENEIKGIESIKNYTNKGKICFGLPDKYNYYFLNFDSISITSIGLVKDIFIVSDNSNTVINIFIFLKDTNGKLTSALSEIFDSPKLSSQSSIGIIDTVSQKFWSKNNISVIVRTNADSEYTKISMHRSMNENNFSGVYNY